MTQREPDAPGPNEVDAPSAPTGERPRIFTWGEDLPEEPGLLRRLLDRFRSDPTPRAPDEAPSTVFRPPVGRRAGSEPKPPRESRRGTAPAVPLPPRPDGWDPPDLSRDPPPEGEDPPGGDPPAERRHAATHGEGHGPGPLYRATLQLLPGRLRPLDPDIVREEIRFVRPSGGKAVVTLGWAEGDPPDHVTVNHPSVQDRHARMSFSDRRWYIESLVAGHPAWVNGEAVPVGGEPRELQSGDEVRLGDASFDFVMP